MNSQKLAQAFLQLSQAMTTIHEALLEQQPVSEAQVRADAAAAAPAQVAPPPTATAPAPAQVAPPPTATAPAPAPAQVAPPPTAQGADPFLAFADVLKSILQTVAPGALNVQLGQMIERYAPGAGAQGQGGIRKIPPEQYQNFLAEVRQAAAALGGAAQ